MASAAGWALGTPCGWQRPLCCSGSCCRMSLPQLGPSAAAFAARAGSPSIGGGPTDHPSPTSPGAAARLCLPAPGSDGLCPRGQQDLKRELPTLTHRCWQQRAPACTRVGQQFLQPTPVVSLSHPTRHLPTGLALGVGSVLLLTVGRPVWAAELQLQPRVLCFPGPAQAAWLPQAHTHTHTCAHMGTCSLQAHPHMHTHLNACMHRHTCTHVHTNMCMYTLPMHPHVHAPPRACTPTPKFAHTCICPCTPTTYTAGGLHTHIDACTSMCMCTYMCAPPHTCNPPATCATPRVPCVPALCGAGSRAQPSQPW